MVTKVLGQVNPAAATNTTAYTVPTGKVAIFNVSFCNMSATPIAVRLAICANGTPTAAEYLEYEATVPQFGVLERSGLVAQEGKNIVVQATTAAASVSVFGYEE